LGDNDTYLTSFLPDRKFIPRKCTDEKSCEVLAAVNTQTEPAVTSRDAAWQKYTFVWERFAASILGYTCQKY
jgi:hypothetical protein